MASPGGTGARAAAIAALAALCILSAGTQARGDQSEYGIEAATATISATQAGAHPDLTVGLRFARTPDGELPAATRDIHFALPPGLVANPGAVGSCPYPIFATTDPEEPSGGCPQDSQVGLVEFELLDQSGS